MVYFPQDGSGEYADTFESVYVMNAIAIDKHPKLYWTEKFPRAEIKAFENMVRILGIKRR